MDAELKEYLDDKFAALAQRTDDKIGAVAQQLDDRITVLAQQTDDKIAALAQRTHDEIAALAQQTHDEIAALAQQTDDKITSLAQHVLHEMEVRFSILNQRLDSIDSRLKLQGGLIQAGSRAIARLSESSESTESRYVDLLTKVDNLERRVNKLEFPGANNLGQN